MAGSQSQTAKRLPLTRQPVQSKVVVSGQSLVTTSCNQSLNVKNSLQLPGSESGGKKKKGPGKITMGKEKGKWKSTIKIKLCAGYLYFIWCICIQVCSGWFSRFPFILLRGLRAFIMFWHCDKSMWYLHSEILIITLTLSVFTSDNTKPFLFFKVVFCQRFLSMSRQPSRSFAKALSVWKGW